MQPTTSDDATVDRTTSDRALLDDTALLDGTLLDLVSNGVAEHAQTHDGAALPGLAPDAYARDHAAFENLSDQRALITAWLTARVARRDGPIAVLSVGCGDGAVDSAIADVLTAGGPRRSVRYVGIEPFVGSATRFSRRMAALDRPNLDAEVQVATFGDAVIDERFDVITFVHSMYYVPDVAETIAAAHALLRPGGELLVLSAPRGVLNQLVGVLAPPVEGHRQWFSDDVASGILEAGLDLAETGTLDACVDLSAADENVLDFTVQAQLTASIRPLVLAYLAEVAVAGTALSLPHPVDCYRIVK